MWSQALLVPLVCEAINNYHLSLSAIKQTNQSHGACSLICSASSSNCLSGSVLFLFLTFPMIPPLTAAKGRRQGIAATAAVHSLGVVAMCAWKNLDLDYVGTSSTNTSDVVVFWGFSDSTSESILNSLEEVYLSDVTFVKSGVKFNETLLVDLSTFLLASLTFMIWLDNWNHVVMLSQIW